MVKPKICFFLQNDQNFDMIQLMSWTMMNLNQKVPKNATKITSSASFSIDLKSNFVLKPQCSGLRPLLLASTLWHVPHRAHCSLHGGKIKTQIKLIIIIVFFS